MSLLDQPKKPILELLAEKSNEMDAGFINEQTNPDGTVETVNELDELMDKKRAEAMAEEKASRYKSHNITTTVLVLVFIIILLVMVVFWINMSPSFTGIYFDKNGNRMEIYHNKSLGSFNIVSRRENKSGVFKKLTGKYYGLYLDDDLIRDGLEHFASNKKISAYIETDTHNIMWNNDLWTPDRNTYTTTSVS